MVERRCGRNRHIWHGRFVFFDSEKSKTENHRELVDDNGNRILCSAFIVPLWLHAVGRFLEVHRIGACVVLAPTRSTAVFRARLAQLFRKRLTSGGIVSTGR